MLKGKNILLAVCGGIAVYKVVDVASRLRKLGANVHVVMTKEATNFVTPLTFQEISGNPVNVSMWDKVTNWNVEHIALANLADLVLIAPATANIIGKIANGIADDMLSTVIMATKAPVFVAPAMNSNMYQNPITQKNINTLREYNYHIIEPASGHLACGVNGIGRLPEPITLVETIKDYVEKQNNQSLKGKKVIVSAAGTREPIDPVRYISNRSSGKMGYAIAKEAMLRGADVTLISGKVNIAPVPFVKLVDVISAKDMYDEVIKAAEDSDIVIKAAAVADYRPAVVSDNKIKKKDGDMSIELTRTEDIIGTLGKNKKKEQFLCGFSMETENMLENSKAKLDKKNLDMIVANNVKVKGAGFGTDTNVVTIITRNDCRELPIMSKEEVADEILSYIMQLKKEKH